MTTQRTNNRNRAAALAVLLLVAASASGCGKALPTSPSMDSSLVRSSSIHSSSLGPSETTGGGGDAIANPASAPIAPETRPISAGGWVLGNGHGKGHAYGRYKK